MTEDDDHPYSSHREAAKQVRTNAEGMGEGVVHDALLEARIEAETHHHRCRQMVASLDTMMDSKDLWPGEVQADLSIMHRMATDMEAWLAAFTSALEKELVDVSGGSDD